MCTTWHTLCACERVLRHVEQQQLRKRKQRLVTAGTARELPLWKMGWEGEGEWKVFYIPSSSPLQSCTSSVGELRLSHGNVGCCYCCCTYLCLRLYRCYCNCCRYTVHDCPSRALLSQRQGNLECLPSFPSFSIPFTIGDPGNRRREREVQFGLINLHSEPGRRKDVFISSVDGESSVSKERAEKAEKREFG